MRAVTTIRIVGAALLGAAALAACTPPPPDGDPAPTTAAPTTAAPTTAAPTTAAPTTAAPTTAPPSVSTALGGSYRVRYGTDATAEVHVSGSTVTVTAGPNLRIEGASCTLPEHTVLAVLNGSGLRYTGSHSWFGTSTCVYGGTYGSVLDLNSDGSFSLTSGTGTHLFTKTADAKVAPPVLASVYETVYETGGTARAHVSGNQLTLSVDSPFRVGGSCNLPRRTVLGVYSGSGTTFTGSHSWFGASTCFYGGTYGSTVHVNADRTLTVTSGTGPHLYIQRSAIPASSATSPVGDFRVRYGTDGVVTVRSSGTNYTASVTTPFTVEGASCQLPASTVVASFSGTGSQISGSHVWFGTSTCTAGGTYGSMLSLNTDGTLTVRSGTGPHLFDRI